MSKKNFFAAALLALLALLIPIEHKYDKLFRFFSLTLIPEGLEISKQYDRKIYFYISDIIALILSMFSIFWLRTPLKKWFGNSLWLIWLCALFSIIASPFASYPIPYFRLLQLFTPIAIFSFLATSEYNFTRVILYGIVIAALGQSVIAIIQYFHQGPLGLRILGEVKEMSSFLPTDGSRWLFDQLFGYPLNRSILLRAQGTFPHPNALGGFMFFSILSTYYLSLSKRVWLIALPLQFFALVLSFSRGALFALAISSAVWFFFFCRTRIKEMVPILIAMLIPFTISIAVLHAQWSSRGGLFNYNSFVQGSDLTRKIQLEAGKNIVLDHPLFGLGLSQFSERSSPYYAKDAPEHIRETAPHNIFLFLACETGILSMIALLFFVLNLILGFFQSPRTDESVLFISLLIGFLFIGLCDLYPILFQQGKLMFFLISALLVANTKKDLLKLAPVYE